VEAFRLHTHVTVLWLFELCAAVAMPAMATLCHLPTARPVHGSYSLFELSLVSMLQMGMNSVGTHSRSLVLTAASLSILAQV